MSRLIGISTAALLFALGLLHVHWAAIGSWGTDVTIRQQDGKPLFQPPPAGTLLVATLLFSAGLVVSGRVGLWGTALPRWPFVAGTWTVVAVFFGRVVGDFSLVGHLALRSALSASRRWMPGCCPERALSPNPPGRQRRMVIRPCFAQYVGWRACAQRWPSSSVARSASRSAPACGVPSGYQLSRTVS
jgi:Protein of unknown function (DUF3995)